MSYLLAILSGYILGSLPFSYWLGKIRGVDLRKVGSGNVGATNLARTVGKEWGIMGFLLDMGKGVTAVILARSIHAWLTPSLDLSLFQILGGISAICGHNWSFFLRFKGGKGVATSTGVFLGLAPVPLLYAAGVWVLILIISGYVSLASILASLSLPLWMWWMKSSPSLIILGGLISLLIIVRHRENIKRLIRGKENRFLYSWKK